MLFAAVLLDVMHGTFVIFVLLSTSEKDSKGMLIYSMRCWIELLVFVGIELQKRRLLLRLG